jgi:hypothetical protein
MYFTKSVRNVEIAFLYIMKHVKILSYKVTTLHFMKFDLANLNVNLGERTQQRCDPFFQFCNFINESGTDSRFILPYLDFYMSLIPTRSCLWFSKVKPRCDPIFLYLNFINERETEM